MPSGLVPAGLADVALDSAMLLVDGEIFGAAMGPVRVERILEYRNLPFNGQKSGVAGGDRKTNHGIRFTGSFLNFGEDQLSVMERNVAPAIAGAVKTWTPKKAGELFATGEYLDAVVVAFRTGSGHLVTVEMPKVYVAYAMESNVEGEVMMQLTLEARLTPAIGVAGTDKSPFTIRRYLPEDLLAPLLRYVPGDSVAARGGEFARASAATYIDNNGIMQQAGSGVIRDNHYLSGARHTLIEAIERTNYALHNRNLGDAFWGVNSLVKSASPVASPDGTMNATRFTQTAGNLNAVSGSVGVASGNNWCDSVYVRAVPGTGAQWVAFRSQRSDLSQKMIWFDVVNGVIGVNEFPNATYGLIEPAGPPGSGWFRIGVRDGFAGTTIGNMHFVLTTGDGVDFAGGDSTRAWDVWGPQHETGGIWTSLIWTTTAEVIRAADVLTFEWLHDPATLFSGYFDITETGSGLLLSEGSMWMLGRDYADAYIGTITQFNGGSYGFGFSGQGGGGGGGTPMWAPAAKFSRMEMLKRFRVADMDAVVSINGAAEVVYGPSAHTGAPATWGDASVDRFRVALGSIGRWGIFAYRKIVFLSGNRTLEFMRTA